MSLCDAWNYNGGEKVKKRAARPKHSLNSGIICSKKMKMQRRPVKARIKENAFSTMTLQLYYSVPILSSVNFITAIWFILCNEPVWEEERTRKREKERQRKHECRWWCRDVAAARLNCEPRKTWKSRRNKDIYICNRVRVISHVATRMLTILEETFEKGRNTGLFRALRSQVTRYTVADE